MRGLASRGRVIHGYPATRSHDDALALLRREVDAGAMPQGRTAEALAEANARALDALSRVVGDSLDFVWLPGVEEGEARRMLGRAMVERLPLPPDPFERMARDAAFARDSEAARAWSDPGPSPRNLSEAEFNEEGAAFAPFVTDEQRADFLAALTREAEKRVLVMPSGVGVERVGSREWAEEKGAE